MIARRTPAVAASKSERRATENMRAVRTGAIDAQIRWANAMRAGNLGASGGYLQRPRPVAVVAVDL